MRPSELQDETCFVVRQRVTAVSIRYTVSVASAEGRSGQSLAFAEHERRSPRKAITFVDQQGQPEPLFTVESYKSAYQGIAYEVATPAGEVLGQFRKEASRSALTASWRLEPAASLPVVGSERRFLMAMCRRLQDTVPVAYHVDFLPDPQQAQRTQRSQVETGATPGGPALSVDRQWGVRDRYRISIHDPMLDRRLAVGLSVVFDALVTG